MEELSNIFRLKRLCGLGASAAEVRQPGKTVINQWAMVGGADEQASGPRQKNMENRIDLPHKVNDGRAAVSAEHEQVGQGPVVFEPVGPEGSPVALLVQQTHRQAAELADHLQSRQTDLDRREAQLNARIAEVENDLRAARLWLREQQKMLDTRKDSVAREEQGVERRLAELGIAADAADRDAVEHELAARAAALQKSEQTINKRRQKIDQKHADLEDRHRTLDERQAQLYQDIEDLTGKRAELAEEYEKIEHQLTEFKAQHDRQQRRESQLDQRAIEHAEDVSNLAARRGDLERQIAEHGAHSDELAQREAQLDERVQEIETALKRFEHLSITEETLGQMDSRTKQLEARKRYLDDAETDLARDQEQLAETRRCLEAERQKNCMQSERDRQQFVAEQSHAACESAELRRKLEQQTEQLEQRETAAQRVGEKLHNAQREVLEMRLAVEESWLKLSKETAPASLVQSISEARERLADHYRQTNAELAERTEYFETLRNELAEQHQQTTGQREELSLWVAQRQTDIEEQASRLVAREQELDRQQAHHKQHEEAWGDERLGYQQEIRKLRAAMHTDEPSPS